MTAQNELLLNSISVVAIHGLGGHAIGSWKASNSHLMWLRDFLPKRMPSVRVMSYGYNTNLEDGDWKQTAESLAKDLLEDLSNFRETTVSPVCRRNFLF